MAQVRYFKEIVAKPMLGDLPQDAGAEGRVESGFCLESPCGNKLIETEEHAESLVPL